MNRQIRLSVVSTTQKRLFFWVLFFAFSWVVIGDLVQFHIEMIWGGRYQDWHQPFTKAQKGAVYKKVKERVQDDPVKAKILACSVSSNLKKHILRYTDITRRLRLRRGVRWFVSFFFSLRAPPVMP